MGVKGRPSAIAELLVNHIEHARWLRGANQQVTEVAAEVSQAARQQALTVQPNGGQPPAATPKTPEEIIQAKFGTDRAKTVLDSFFG